MVYTKRGVRLLRSAPKTNKKQTQTNKQNKQSASDPPAYILPRSLLGVLLLDEVGDVLHGVRGLVRLLLHPEQEVGAVEALQKRPRVAQLQALDDAIPDLCRRDVT